MTTSTHQRASRRLGILAVAIALILSSSAWALDKNDIINMYNNGLDANTLVTVIRSSSSELTMDAQDLEELEAEGIPDAVISELRLQLGLEADTPTTTEQDLEEQRRLEEERILAEQARIEREREELRRQIEAEQQRGQQVDSEFQGLNRAAQFHRSGDYITAAAVYSRFLQEMMPSPVSDEYYEATFGLVRSLHALGIRHAIRGEALEVALAGAFRNHFEEAVVILHDVVAETGFSSPRISGLSNEIVEEFNREFRDEFHFFMGRYYYDAGELARAHLHLAEVSVDGDYAARAAFLDGVAYINEPEPRYINGVESFQNAIVRANTEDVPEDLDVVENAYLALARVAYQIGNFGGALYYYQKVDSESSRATTALFEAAWTYFLSGDMNRALGGLHSLNSPYHAHRFYPDLYVLEAAAYLYSCNIDEAKAAISAFEGLVVPLRDAVRQVLVDVGDPNVFYQIMFDQEQAIREGVTVLPNRVRSVVLSDASFYSMYEEVRQLEEELFELRLAESDLGTWGSEAVSGLETDLSNRSIAAGLLIRTIVSTLSQDLDDWFFHAQLVELEINDLEATALEAILARGEGAITEGTTLFLVADDWYFWPWEGEYWFDEVANYRANLTTRCPDDLEF